LAKVRVRQHVNPLSHKYRHPIAPPDWDQVYQDMTLPLHLDIGCARGNKIPCLLRIESLTAQILYHQCQCTTWTISSKS